MNKMSCVRAADNIDFMDSDFLFFADALEHALRSGSPHADGNIGILGFERLAQSFCDRNRHSGVECDRALLSGGLNHGRANWSWLRRGGLERLWEDGANRQRRPCLEHVAFGKLPISHGIRSLTAVARERPQLCTWQCSMQLSSLLKDWHIFGFHEVLGARFPSNARRSR